MKINIHAGHNPDGKVACGAVGLIKESTEARKVKDEVIKYLKKVATVNDCTCDNGINQSDVLNKIVRKCNEHDVDLDVSIHFNCGRNDLKGDGRNAGVEVLLYDIKDSYLNKVAENTCKEIAKLGFTNRGIKVNPSLYFLKSTKAKAMLIECCFVDDKDDINIYDYKKMAKAIVVAILNSKSFNVKTTITGVKLRLTDCKNFTERLPKGSKVNISKVKFVGNTLYGYTNTYKRWICLKNVKSC